LADGHEVAGIDSLISGDRANIPEKVTFQKIDCNNLYNVTWLMQDCDLVYHCAATAYEGLSIFSPNLIVKNIVGASTAVFSAAVRNKVKRIVYCSSMARYGNIITPFREDSFLACKPVDPYGIAKLASEQILISLCKIHGIEYSIAVPHNIIGPRQKYDDPFRNVASIMINLMLQGRPPVIYGDGHQKRCFSFIDDCVDCMKQMGTSPAAVGQIINIGPDKEVVTILELANRIAKLIGFKGEPIFYPDRPMEVKQAICCSDKARELLGYKEKISLDEGLQSMIDFIKSRGPKPFKYHLPIEIANEHLPKTWSEKLF